MKRDIRIVVMIGVPYDRVRDRMRDHPAALLGGEGDRIRTELSAGLRGTEVSREVEVEIVGFDEPAGAAGGANLTLRADAVRHPDLFPHLEARIEAVPVNDERTAVTLLATYKPPLGVVGGLANSVGLHRIAERSLANLFEQIASRLHR